MKKFFQMEIYCQEKEYNFHYPPGDLCSRKVEVHKTCSLRWVILHPLVAMKLFFISKFPEADKTLCPKKQNVQILKVTSVPSPCNQVIHISFQRIYYNNCILMKLFSPFYTAEKKNLICDS